MRVSVLGYAFGALFAAACGGTTNTPSEAQPPKHVAIAAGAFHTCGLRLDGSLTCWGNEPGDQPGAGLESVTPPGTYTAVAVARRYACAIDAEQSVQCFQLGPDTTPVPTPTGKFVEISAAFWSTCGVPADGHVVCWADGSPPAPWHPEETFSHIAVTNGICGITTKGVTKCWGAKDTPFPGTYVGITSGWEEVCALRADGSATCLLPDFSVEGHAGPFSAIGGGSDYGCGLRKDGSLECWGQTPPPPEGRFSTLAVGMSHACAIDDQDAVRCWTTALFGGRPAGTGDPPADFP